MCIYLAWFRASLTIMNWDSLESFLDFVESINCANFGTIDGIDKFYTMDIVLLRKKNKNKTMNRFRSSKQVWNPEKDPQGKSGHSSSMQGISSTKMQPKQIKVHKHSCVQNRLMCVHTTFTVQKTSMFGHVDPHPCP